MILRVINHPYEFDMKNLCITFFPQPEWIVDAIHQRILPLPGHICTHNCTELEQIRENRLGI